MNNVNTIDERRSKIVRSKVFHCHLSPNCSSDFYPRSQIVKSVFDCRLSGVRYTPDDDTHAPTEQCLS